MKKYQIKAKSLCGVIFKGKLYNTDTIFDVVMTEKELDFYKEHIEIVKTKELVEKTTKQAKVKGEN